ncbi:MAG: ELM1/GtrOC1 family putative glycosyltransferase, partial [Pseudomonadota bacterium]
RPLVWLLLGGKAGDNAQLRAVAAKLDTEVREWRLGHNLLREVPNAWLGASLASLKGKPAFTPPWPDMVLGVGRRSVPAARWIQRASPNPPRLVWLGRPRAPLAWFDLVLSTGQYGLPEAPNLLRLPLPLTEPPNLAAPARRVALLGGPSWSATITRPFLDAFAKAARGDEDEPVSLLTSPRTPIGAAAYLKDRLGAGAEIYDWAAEQGRENPYRAWLGEARYLVVSCDSVSMICDAVSTGRPVSVVRMPEPVWLSTLRRMPFGARWLNGAGNWPVLAPPPNLEGVFRDLIAAGLARPNGDLIHLEEAAPAIAEAHDAAIARIRALLA